MAKKKVAGSGQPSMFSSPVPKMPQVYYSGDRPNPNLRQFVEEHVRERPYDSEKDTYDVPAFDKPIETTKATAIYNMHTYWSKKPHDAIRQYIRHYTQPGDLVFDPFCGSGGTALAALMEGRKAIAIDRSPAATFITKNYCTPVDVEELRRAFEELKARVKPEIDWLYETRCDRCGGKATTGYTVYSQVFQCPRCLEKVPLFDCVEVAGKTAKGKAKKISVCPHCYKKGIEEKISTRAEKFGAVPVLVSYLCEAGCNPKRGERRHNDTDPKKREYFEKYDLGKIREIEGRDIPHWYPTDRMMHAPEDQEQWGVKWRAGTSNFRTVDELFTRRNLWAVSAIMEGVKNLNCELGDALKFVLTGVTLGLSRMNRYMPNATFPFYVISGTYYLPQVSCEEPVWKHFENKHKRLLKGYVSICERVKGSAVAVSTQDGRRLDQLPGASMDYVFTDPAYGANVQYGELNFIWEAWLGLDTHWHDEEIVVNDVRGKTEQDWANMMRQAFFECHRVLKPGRWLSLCYHDTSEGTWELVQDLMAEIGFVVDQSGVTLFIETGQKSFNQLTADKVTKRDLVINFRKPRLGEVVSAVAFTGSEDASTFREKVHTVMREHLAAHPGAAKDRIYDQVVSRMVRAGAMEPHDFEELLRQVAVEVKVPVKKDLFENEDPNLWGTNEVGRWYLKETELAVRDEAESAKEDHAAANLTTFMKKYLKEHPEEEGVHYSDLFERYVYGVKDKPRRELAEFLPDYFYKTEEGTWRPAANEDEEQAKADGRTKGTGRRIKRYLAMLAEGIEIPEGERSSDATLAEWVRHCKRSGMYGQGKELYERGGLRVEALPEEVQVAVEEDYQVCMRLLLK